MKQLKKQLISFIMESESALVLYNGAGGVVDELSREEVESMVESCKTKSELSRLIMGKWMYSDVYESFEELLKDIETE